MQRETVASTAPLRKRAVTERNFGKSSGRLFYLFNAAANDQPNAKKIALWNRFIPMTPRQAFNILGRDLPRDTAIMLTLKPGGKGEISFFADKKFRDDGSFNLKQKILDAGIVRVFDGHKGKGIGRTLFRNQAEFFYACGARRFEIIATLENGGYSWARLGFLPDDLRDAEFREDCLKPMRERLQALRPLLKDREYKELAKLLRLKSKEDFRALADSPVDLGPRLNKKFNIASGVEAAPQKNSRKARRLERSLSAYFDEDVLADIKTRAANGQKLNIGRLLMTGTSWSGSLDMEDAAQMRRFGDYAGGWRYLKIS